MGVYWDQPIAAKFLFATDRVLVPRNAFEELKNYSRSCPSGVYSGKMWKAYDDEEGCWLLRWYDPHPTEQGMCIVKQLPILVDDVGVEKLMGGT